ncbi:MAG: hypothetical protein NTZ33_04840 [Bacteroidetes bacterium]|nr:hypothetical protein [Bacteroidota bacterium]
MEKESKEKKIIRGISKDFSETFKKSELYKLYEKHKDELFIGVRNNYLNLYYNCDNIAKINYTKSSVYCEIDKYYLDGIHYKNEDKEKRFKIEPYKICEQYEEIKKNSNAKLTFEKKAQSKLVLLNNGNKESIWFCIDVEYIKQFKNQKEKDKTDFNGRFDIIALSKEKPHKVALIELKYGKGAIGGKSGIYKHVKDFNKFCDKGFFEGHLKQEIIEIIKSQKELGISVPFELPNEVDVLTPEFYFIILDNNAKTLKASTPKQTLAGYLFKKPRWGCKRLSTQCVETEFGDITKKNNKFHATFLFSKATLENIKITDIIDGVYDEKIKPE